MLEIFNLQAVVSTQNFFQRNCPSIKDPFSVKRMIYMCMAPSSKLLHSIAILSVCLRIEQLPAAPPNRLCAGGALGYLAVLSSQQHSLVG